MKIQATTDYDRFSILTGNREIIQGHVKNIIKSISANNLLEQNPIIVNKDYSVIDGQHRLEAARQMGLPIYYVVADGDISTVQRLNSNLRPWSISDYVESYVKIGMSDYYELKEFKKKWGIPYTTAGELLMYGKKSSNNHTSEDIKAGTFLSLEPQGANEIMEWVAATKDYADPITLKDRDYISALIVLMNTNGITLEGFARKLSVVGKKITRCVNRAEYLRQIEEIVNYKNKTGKIRLF